MSRIVNTVGTLNSAVRTIVAVAVLGGLGVAGWYGYTTYNAAEFEAQRKAEELHTTRKALNEAEQHREKLVNRLTTAHTRLGEKEKQLREKNQIISDNEKQITQLAQDVEEHKKRIERLDTALRLLKVDYRLAHLTVTDVWTDSTTGNKYFKAEFVEVNDDGRPIDKPKIFQLKGDTVYLDSWTVQFEDQYVEQADELRATSLHLFKSIYGNSDGPDGGFPLEYEGVRPNAYGRGQINQFETQIWNDFWEIAHNPERAKKLGISAIGGEVHYVQVRAGKTYPIELRASAGLKILPAVDAAPKSKGPAA